MTYSQAISVVGAGIMGLSVAYAIQQDHPDSLVTIDDQDGFPPQNSSSIMAGGMLSPYSEIEHMPDEFLRAGLKGVEIWERYNLALGEAIGFQKNGSLLLSHPEDRYILERFQGHLDQKYQDHYADCDQAGIYDLEPQLAAKFGRGLYLKNEACLDPALTMAALAREICSKDDGGATSFDWVIDCRGYASAQDDADLRGVKGETLLVRNTDFHLDRPVRLMHPRYPLYIIPRGDHVFMIGATSIESADTHMSLRSTMELASALYSLHPSFGDAHILDAKAGVRPAYPDNLPRITIEGRTIRCNGLFRHGYLLAPVMAQCVSDYLVGQDNEFTSLFMRG